MPPENKTAVKNTATAEDQQQINKFARMHKNYKAAKENLAVLYNDAQNLNDAADEVMLLDDAESTPILTGSVFLHCSQEEIGERLEQMKETTQGEMKVLQIRIAEMEAELKVLRAELYAKFGDNIHLEEEEEDIGGGTLSIGRQNGEI